MYIFGIHFHKWQEVYENEIYKFHGEKCERTNFTGYRKCFECGIIQKYFYDSQGGYWSKINDCETRILDKNIILDDNTYFMKNFRDNTK